ncbi:helix-turn-helix domain-containing protein [Morganella morganii]|uniref:helix-turn-helix domain-containing protein n=1 Tax=Morganella morganii TaxID=582 RepID=UPI003EBDCA59
MVLKVVLSSVNWLNRWSASRQSVRWQDWQQLAIIYGVGVSTIYRYFPVSKKS